MQIEITLKNYRCFPDSKPATFSLQKGFTSFVGVNNSGKSSLLKFFYEFRPLFNKILNPNQLIEAMRGNAQDFTAAPSILDNEEVFSNVNDRNLEIQIHFKATNHAIKQDVMPIPSRIDIIITRGTTNFIAKLYLSDGQLDINDKFEIRDDILYIENNQKADLTDIFQVFKDLGNTLYIGPFRNALNVSSNIDYFDIKVGQDFISSWRNFKTGSIKKNNESAIRITADIKRIFGYTNLEINPSEDRKTLQIFVNEKSYTLTELGSGITQFILVLANAAMKQPSYILIDEPELNLHPTLQLDFLTTLGFYAQEGILYATHNIGLARAYADRIYSVHKIEEGKSELCEFEAEQHLSELLGELSFSGYRELGFDQILLVEGPTDVKTIQQFLRLYKKDHQIILLPLGGKSLIRGSVDPELEEIKRISKNVCALIDSERTSEGEELQPRIKEFIEACNKAKINCKVLELRAIENYLTDKSVKITFGDKYQALGPYQALKEISPSWSKSDNWRIAREMNSKELDSTDLGEFLKSL